MGYAVSMNAGEWCIRVGSKTTGMAKRVLKELDMKETPENIRWILANTYKVNREHGKCVDQVVSYGYYENVPVVTEC